MAVDPPHRDDPQIPRIISRVIPNQESESASLPVGRWILMGGGIIFLFYLGYRITGCEVGHVIFEKSNCARKSGEFTISFQNVWSSSSDRDAIMWMGGGTFRQTTEYIGLPNRGQGVECKVPSDTAVDEWYTPSCQYNTEGKPFKSHFTVCFDSASGKVEAAHRLD